MKNIIVYKYQNPGAHWNLVSPAGPLFLWAMKGGRPRQGGEKVVIGQSRDSFLKVMDREAATRMSGGYWMNAIN